MKTKKPNLFIVGQPKAGTTALQYLLDQHPEIFVYDHGGYFGKKKTRKTEKEYSNLFSKVKNQKVIGDSSEGCFYYEKSASNIKKFNPNAKIIIILREPIEWLRSAYQQRYRNLHEERPIEKVIQSKEYLEKTNYSKYVKRYLDNFSKKNIKIILFEDFKKNNSKTLKKIFRFLGVDENFNPRQDKKNPSRTLRFKRLQFLLEKLGLKRRKIRRKMPLKIWKMLKKIGYKEEKIKISQPIYDELKKKIKPEVEKVDKLLHEKGFLDKKRNLVKEWDYKDIK